ncbi:unnamed protein product, partial [Phaeothamnion confervicola]
AAAAASSSKHDGGGDDKGRPFDGGGTPDAKAEGDGVGREADCCSCSSGGCCGGSSSNGGNGNGGGGNSSQDGSRHPADHSSPRRTDADIAPSDEGAPEIVTSCVVVGPPVCAAAALVLTSERPASLVPGPAVGASTSGQEDSVGREDTLAPPADTGRSAREGTDFPQGSPRPAHGKAPRRDAGGGGGNGGDDGGREDSGSVTGSDENMPQQPSPPLLWPPSLPRTSSPPQAAEAVATVGASHDFDFSELDRGRDWDGEDDRSDGGFPQPDLPEPLEDAADFPMPDEPEHPKEMVVDIVLDEDGQSGRGGLGVKGYGGGGIDSDGGGLSGGGFGGGSFNGASDVGDDGGRHDGSGEVNALGGGGSSGSGAGRIGGGSAGVWLSAKRSSDAVASPWATCPKKRVATAKAKVVNPYENKIPEGPDYASLVGSGGRSGDRSSGGDGGRNCGGKSNSLSSAAGAAATNKPSVKGNSKPKASTTSRAAGSPPVSRPQAPASFRSGTGVRGDGGGGGSG